MNLGDLTVFASTFAPNPDCPSEPGYIDCANYRAAGADSCILLSDLVIFSAHFSDKYEEQGGPGLVAGPVLRQDVDVIIEPKTSGEGKLADVTSFELRVANADSIALLGIVIEVDEELQFAGFTPNAGFEKRLVVTPMAGRTNALSVIVIAGRPITGEVEVGTMRFKCQEVPSGDELVIVAGEAMRSDGTTFGVSRTGAAAVEGATITYRNVLGRNRPNPFNPTTTIEYSIENDSRVNLAIYNVNGELVRTLVNEYVRRGDYVVSWDGTNSAGDPVASGVYLYKLETPYFRDTKKLTILR